MPALPLSGVVIAKDEGDRIGRCVASLAAICSDLLVLDSGSSDDTVAVATAAGARVEQQPWLGFARRRTRPSRVRASHGCCCSTPTNGWMRSTARAARALRFRSRRRSRRLAPAAAHAFPRDAALNHGGWGRETVERLFRNDLRYQPADVHERLDTAGRRLATVAARIEHDTARSDAEYATKLQRYAGLWAQQKRAEGRHAGALAAPLHAAAYWLKTVVLRGGFLDGPVAMRYHALHARYVRDKTGCCATVPRAGTP